MMEPIKSESPSPSSTGDGEEAEIYDLYTPDAPEANESNTGPTNRLKRSNTASGGNSSNKRRQSAPSKSKTGQAVARPKRKSPTKTNTLVMGFDPGTTCSGASYDFSANPRPGPIVVTRWDGTNTDHVKFPSAIELGPQDEIWGFDANEIPGALRWFKLLLVKKSDLDEEVRTSEQLQKARVALQASGKSAVEVMGIFLKRMFEHAVEQIKISRGAQMVDSSRFHVVFTVPAIWPEYARRRMKEAIDLAGILKTRPIGQTTHEFISEPEAAALATLSSLEGVPNIKAGDTMVIIDCGGGTVDIITYRITKMDPTMTVQEVVAGKGALCGAIFVEERFMKLVVKKLKEISEDAMERVTEQELREILTRDWEEKIRNQFNGAAKSWTVRYPFSLIDRDRLDPRRGYPTFTITSDEVKEVFEPSVEKIRSLVNSQIEAADKKDGKLPEFAILVGGFGRSPYVREYLKQSCYGVEILQCAGSEPWSAILRGATIHAMTRKRLGSSLKVAVKSRIARESLGVVCEESWDEDRHHPQDKRFDFILRKDVAIKVMRWHVVQGEEVPVPHTISIKLTKYLDELPPKIVTTIYKSLADRPPARKDDTVVMATEITWDIEVDWGSLETFVNNQGKTFRKLEYTVEMKCSAGATEFNVYHDGYRQANKNVALKFGDSADA